MYNAATRRCQHSNTRPLTAALGESPTVQYKTALGPSVVGRTGVDSPRAEPTGVRTPRAAAALGAARVDSSGGGGTRRAGGGARRLRFLPPASEAAAARDGFHGEAAGRQGAAGRHGAADSGRRGEPESAVAHGARPG